MRRACFLAWGLLAALLAAGGAGAQETCPEPERDDAKAAQGHPRAADLTCLRSWVVDEGSFSAAARSQALDRVDALLADPAPMSDAAFLLAMAEITALADNGHSNLSVGAVYNRLGLLPIRTSWLDDGLFVTRAATEHRSLLGARVLEIAGHTPDELLQRMGRYHGGTDEMFKAYYHVAYFLSPAVLHAAGLIEGPDSVPILVESGNGNQRNLRLATWNGPRPHPRARPWRYLVPQPLRGEDGGWTAVLKDLPGDRIPWALREPRQVFRYRYLGDHEVAHIQLRANIDVGNEDISDFLDDVEDHLRRDRPRHVIVDNRQNGGGDLTQSADFMVGLHERLPDDGRIYSLTSGATFSAGIYSAFLPKFAAPERALVVGSLVGDRTRFWAEGRGLQLPESSWFIGRSTQLHDLGAGCQDRSICHIRKGEWNAAVGSFEPDETVPTRSRNLFEGRDAQLEWVLGHVSESRGGS